MSEKEIDRQDLMKQLSDAAINWTHDELMEVIRQELRKDSSVLDMILIDTAAARLLQLQGKGLTGENLHQMHKIIKPLIISYPSEAIMKNHPATLMRTIGKTRRIWRQYVRVCALSAGIPKSYRTVIMYLYHHPGAGQRDVAEYGEITTSAINQAVKVMQAEGYLHKETAPNDRRGSRLYLTDKSIAIAEKLHRQLAQADQDITDLIGEDKEAEMIALLEKVADYIRKDMTSC